MEENALLSACRKQLQERPDLNKKTFLNDAREDNLQLSKVQVLTEFCLVSFFACHHSSFIFKTN